MVHNTVSGTYRILYSYLRVQRRYSSTSPFISGVW